MPRKPRIHYSNAFYHVMLRGNYRQNIFHFDRDYRYFYNLLGKVVRLYGCRIHLFCLMTNHVHLVVEVNYAPLGKIIQSIASPYARYFNKKFNESGHLFQGRYQSKIIQDERYFSELCYYIHSNPTKAGLVKNLDDYPWSSHVAYTGQQLFDWLTTSYVSRLIGNIKKSVSYYRDFIKNYTRDDVGSLFCQFDQQGKLIINSSNNTKLNEEDFFDLKSYSMPEIISVIANAMQLSDKTITSKCRNEKNVIARNMVVYYGHYYARYHLNYIAVFLNRSPAGVSKSLHRLLSSNQRKGQVQYWINRVREAFLINRKRTKLK